MRHSALVTLLAIVCACAQLAAQCSDPLVPTGGFAVTLQANQPITYSDQFRTLADVRIPTATAGTCGWPLLVCVHGFPADKNGEVATQAAQLAAQGYLVVTYDVRGQGSTIALNPGRGTTLMALHEWIDMFEVIEWAEQQWPALVDRSRVGVLGISQGGAHSWAAAAYSGRVPPPNTRRSAPFPTIHAVAPTVMVPSHTEAGTLGGTAFNESWAALAFQTGAPNVSMDAGLQSVMQSYLLAEDPAGLRAWMLADPGRDFVPLLAQTTVPVLCRMAWLDETMGANASIRALNSMPATTPRRLVLTTGLHGTPTNAYEEAEHASLLRRWLDRFLKHATEAVEAGPPVLSAVLPGNPPTYLTGSALWRHRADTSFPPSDATTAAWYLRQTGVLAASAPAASEPADQIVHSVPAGYNARTWLSDGSGTNLPVVFARMPLSAQTYTSAALTADTEIAGIPRLLLEVTPQQARFFLSAKLECITPTGSAQLLTLGHTGVRQAGAPTPQLVTIELRAVDALCLAGSRLRLTVQNHALIKPAQVETLDIMPQFSSYTVAIEHSPLRPSRLELPLRSAIGLDCATAATSLPVASAGPVTFALRSNAAFGGSIYAIVASLTGQGPPVPLPGGSLAWLIPDAITDAFASAANSPQLQGFLGTLDAQGSATATLDLRSLAPQLAALRGLQLHLAPLVVRGSAIEAGAPRSLRFD